MRHFIIKVKFKKFYIKRELDTVNNIIIKKYKLNFLIKFYSVFILFIFTIIFRMYVYA